MSFGLPKYTRIHRQSRVNVELWQGTVTLLVVRTLSVPTINLVVGRDVVTLTKSFQQAARCCRCLDFFYRCLASR